ncbi:MAG TPA: flavodoxin [Candidatus Scatomorpha merdigallinarum]|nr:flavodoxin [Candidatus Scatomorpha merdigallinarum]
MPDTLILYKSKYGASRRYAALLAERLGCEALELDKAGEATLRGKGTVILAAGVYAGGIAGLSKFAKLLRAVPGVRAAVLAVGASPYDEKALRELRERSKALPGSVPLFYARGAWDEEAMSFKDRTMCKMLQKMVAKQDPGSTEPWMCELLAAMGEKRDWVDAEYLKPLLEYIEG